MLVGKRTALLGILMNNAIAPDHQHDLAKLGLRAMIGGSLACFMTACIAGLLL
ncbi:MAG TPA: nucleoside transporter C-terminal domain-containing protein [Phormidium sp.]